MEAFIPTEIGMPTIRKEIYKETNAEAITKDLDTIDELRESAAVHSVLPAEAGKLTQSACKVGCIQSRQVSLKKNL